MSFKAYPDYMDVGLDWIESIPKHWLVRPNRALFVESNITNRDNEKLLSVTISKGIITQEELLNSSSKKDSSNLDKSKYKLVEPNDIAYNKMRAWQGAIGVSKFRGIVSPAYIIHKPKIKICPDYYHYLFRSASMIKVFEKWSYGITSDQWSLRPEHFRLITNILPPYEEQKQIARYLDYKNHLFNKYIRIKKKQIELLKELKQVVINDAVTGKIDVRTGKPYPKYKDSGVEWIGMIPEEWTCKRLKELSKIVLGKMLKPVKSEGDVLKPYLRSTNIQWLRPNVSDVNSMWFTPRELSLYRLSKNDILVSEGGEVGRACIWDDELLECYIQNSVHKITTNQDILPLYLLYSFTEKASKGFFKAFVNRVSIGHLTREKIVSIPFIVPPPETQESIIKFLAKIDQRTELTLSLYLSQITTIKELQTRLISDVVTGKLDVRSIEIPDFEEEPEELDEEIIDDSIEDAANAD
jgi:type I restriction enzyme S subunit